MNQTNDRLFGDEDLRHIVRAEVAAYRMEDAVHTVLHAGTCILLMLIGVAIFLKVGGVI